MKCNICYHHVNIKNEAFLNSCYHHFCFKCIIQWSQKQIENMQSNLLCPICRSPYEFIYYECLNDIYKKKWLCCNDKDKDKDVLLNTKNEIEISDDIIKRRLKYEKNSLIHLTKPIAHELKIRKSNDNETRIWLKKELESLLLDSDVKLLIDAIIAIDENKDELKKILISFLDEKTDLFIHYYELFLTSGLNNKAFEEWISNINK